MAQVAKLDIDQVNQRFYATIDQSLSCHLPNVLINLIKEYYHGCAYQMFSHIKITGTVDVFIGQGINSWVNFPTRFDKLPYASFAGVFGQYLHIFKEISKSFLIDMETKKDYRIYGLILGVINNSLYKMSDRRVFRYDLKTDKRLSTYNLYISGACTAVINMKDCILLFEHIDNVYNVYKITETGGFLAHPNATFYGCEDYALVGDRILFLGNSTNDAPFYFWRDNKVVMLRWGLPDQFKSEWLRIHYNSEERRLYLYRRYSVKLVYYCEPFDENGDIQIYISWQTLRKFDKNYLTATI